MVLFVVNTTGAAASRELDFSAYGSGGQSVKSWLVADRDGELNAANSFADPRRVTSQEAAFQVESSKFIHSFPAYSLTVLEWAEEK